MKSHGKNDEGLMPDSSMENVMTKNTSCAPRTNRTKRVKELGLKPSKHDQCLFYTYMKDLMIVLYVDDAGIAAPTVELISMDLRPKDSSLQKKEASVSFSELSLRKIPRLDPSP
jgi:hypothetical protein